MQASGLGLSVQNMPREAPGFLQDSTQGPCPMWALPMPTRDDSSHRPGPGQNADCKQGTGFSRPHTGSTVLMPQSQRDQTTGIVGGDQGYHLLIQPNPVPQEPRGDFWLFCLWGVPLNKLFNLWASVFSSDRMRKHNVLYSNNITIIYNRGFPGGSVVKNPPAKQKTQV